MNTIFCCPLNIINSPFVENFDPFSMPKTRHSALNGQVLSSDIKDFFSSLNLKIVLIEVFYSEPFLRRTIHTDKFGGDYTKINWIFGGEDSVMNWYKPIVEKKSSGFKTAINSDFISYKPDEVEHIYSEKLIKPSLVQVGIPHDIKNGPNHRWCVSLVYIDKFTKERPTMNQSLELFKNFLI